MESSGNVIRAEGLTKFISMRRAVDTVSFAVADGTIFGLIGRNGAGKTTTLRLLLGLLRPDRGRSQIFGESSMALSAACRQRIGYLAEDSFWFRDLPVEYILDYIAAFHDEWDWDRVRDLGVRMRVCPSKPLGALSLGQRRAAELFLTFAPDPDLLILDDPWAGIDAALRHEFLKLILEAAREHGKTILFTSHALADVERIADRIGILHDGAMRDLGDLDDLKGRTKQIRIALPARGDPESVTIPGEIERRVDGETLTVVTQAYGEGLLHRLRSRFPHVDVDPMNLEAIFLSMVGADEPATEAGDQG